MVSTKSVLFFNFLTDLGVPIDDCICFSITNGDSDVICLSLFFDSITMNLGKLSSSEQRSSVDIVVGIRSKSFEI